MNTRALLLTCGAALFAASPTSLAGEVVVFYSDFDSTMPPQVTSGVAQLAGVQGYAGLGPVERRFGGSFLRSPTGNIVTVQLTNLPPHDSVDTRFLFAAIDSLDGTGTFPEGDFLRVRVDGQQIFRESFANATDSQDQTYVPPVGVQLVRRVDLGFSGPGSFYTDSAYDMGLEPRFRGLAHAASTLTVDFIIEGPGIQDLGDESWALDELTISLSTTAACDPIDFNQNSLFPEDQDLIDFLSVLAGGPCSPGNTCNDIDFNNDGLFPSDDDLVAFLRVLAGGTCN